jgi:hypothetical protein
MEKDLGWRLAAAIWRYRLIVCAAVKTAACQGLSWGGLGACRTIMLDENGRAGIRTAIGRFGHVGQNPGRWPGATALRVGVPYPPW